MPQVTIYHDGGTTETIPTTTGWSLEEQIGEMWRLTITVDRDLAQAVSLTRKEDEVELAGYRRGVLADVDSGTESWTLTVYSPEWYATLTEPIPGGTRVQGNDQSLITDRINAVNEWSVGTVGNFSGPMTYVFTHAFNHEALRTIEANVTGELQFNDDGSVDYVSDLGSDRTGSVTLSPGAGTIEREIRIVEQGRTLDATHVRVIGAHEGEAQRFATLVPDDDPATYENRVNYTTSRWSPGDAKDWDRWENKDVMSQDTIEEEAATLGDELTEEYVEAETTVSGVDLNVGDWVRVVKPDANLDREMRVHRLVTQSVDETPAAVVQDVTLSTRTLAREDVGADRRDIQRFNTAFQGSSVAVNIGPYVDAIDSGDPVTIPFYYPDLEFENNAEIQIRGLSYRIDSVGAASGGDHDHSVSVLHPSHDHSVSINATSTDNDNPFNVDESTTVASNTAISTGWQTLDSFTPSQDTSSTLCVVEISRPTIESFNTSIDVRIERPDFTYVPDAGGATMRVPNVAAPESSSGLPAPISGTVVLEDYEDRNGEELEVQVNPSDGTTIQYSVTWICSGKHTHDVSDTDTSTTALGTTDTETSDASGPHTHPPDPGIYTTGDTPSGVDLYANGSLVASNVGSGTFETIVNANDEFTPGAWNELEVRSDTLGRVQVTTFLQGYDQIGTR